MKGPDVPLPSFDVAAAFRNGNPYPTYTRYRNEDPVHIGRYPDSEHQQVHLFRHADCVTTLRDTRIGVEWRRLENELWGESLPNATPETFGEMASMFMLFRDPPVHTRLRGTANLVFTPRQVERLRPHVEAVASRLASNLREAGQPVDFMSEFAFPLPMLVIATLLGVPEEDFRLFRSLAGDIAAAIDFPVDGLEDFVARVDRSTAELDAYLRRLIAQRRFDPKVDLISQLVHASSEEEQLSEHELVATCILLVVAGHETTVNLIGNGTRALLTHPEQWAILQAEHDLARNATEELLRYDPPIQFTTRTVFEPLEIDGVQLNRGDGILFMLASANRDESVFPNPDTVDIRRKVGRIMSFGMGIHFCLGAPLARLEGEIAFATLARELPHLQLVSETPVWRPGAIFHGLQELPVIVR